MTMIGLWGILQNKIRSCRIEFLLRASLQEFVVVVAHVQYSVNNLQFYWSQLWHSTIGSGSSSEVIRSVMYREFLMGFGTQAVKLWNQIRFPSTWYVGKFSHWKGLGIGGAPWLGSSAAMLVGLLATLVSAQGANGGIQDDFGNGSGKNSDGRVGHQTIKTYQGKSPNTLPWNL